jgi:O-antigen/teichoic acid export membrane protein
MPGGTMGLVILGVAVILAAVIAGSVRIERDPLAPRPPRRVVSELVGFGLLGAVVVLVVYLGRAFPGSHPVQKGPAILFGGAAFVVTAAMLLASYFRPEHNSVFRALSTLWENAPGATGGRSGLLFLGVLFGLLGAVLMVVGGGIFG